MHQGGGQRGVRERPRDGERAPRSQGGACGSQNALLDIISPDSYPAQVRRTGGLWNPRLWNPETFSGSLSILVGTAPQRAP